MQLVSEVRKQSDVAGLFNGFAYATLVFEAGSGQAAGQNLTLLIDQHQQKIGVFVVDVLEALLTEAAVPFALRVDGDRIQVTDVFVVGHDR